MTPLTSNPSVIARRQRWLVPFTAGSVLIAALVVSGTVSLTTVLAFALIAGCVAPHLAGHAAHVGHGTERPPRTDLGSAETGGEEA